MKSLNKDSLLSFYFGSLEESERMQVEKELLQDPEALLDYLDLKREIESAARVPQQPSDLLWHRLRPLTKKKKLWYLTAAAGLVAAMLAFMYISITSKIESGPVLTNNGILFDSAAEHSFAADVL